MRRLAGTALWCCILVLLAVTHGMACGDKVLALGRAIKLRYVSTHSASILLYLRSGTPAGRSAVGRFAAVCPEKIQPGPESRD